MKDLDSVVIFVRTVVTGSLSAAARELRVTPSAISKKIAKLEDRLGVVLLNRNSRKLSLTDIGREFYDACADGLSTISQAENAIAQFSTEARGMVRVAVGQGFGRLHVAPLIPAFLERYPDIRVELLFGRLTGHVFDERVDVLISPTDPPDSNFIVRPLLRFARVACAAPAYLKKHGRPTALDDLSRHNCLVFTNSNAGVEEWIFRTQQGRRRVRVSGNFQTNNHEALYVAALNGLGIAHMPTYVIAPALETGDLVTLFEDEAADAGALSTMSAYYPQARNRLKRVNVFVDFLIEHFRGLQAGLGRPAPRTKPIAP